MLRDNNSIKIYNRANFMIWMAMAFQAGLLNVGGFLSCHQFVSHVTGFATLFGTEFFNKDFVAAVAMLTVPLTFLLGAMISGQLIDIKIHEQRRPRYHIVFSFLFLILTAIAIGGHYGLLGRFGEPLAYTRDYTVLISLCLICGMQNAMITSSSGAVVRTTHLTGITTDLGLGIVRYLNRKNHSNVFEQEGASNAMRFSIIAFFILGSLVGAFAFNKYEFKAFFIAAMISGTLGVLTHRKYRAIEKHS